VLYLSYQRQGAGGSSLQPIQVSGPIFRLYHNIKYVMDNVTLIYLVFISLETSTFDIQ
jgi:hypothetical protein